MGLCKLLCAFLFALVVSACETSFVVIGDVPYDAKDKTMLRDAVDKITDAGSSRSYPFVVHVGDFKASTEPCSDDIDNRFQQLIDDLSPIPVFYTPGDNELSDCDPRKLGQEYWVSETTRVTSIREKFFQSPPAGSERFKYISQNEQPENASWVHRNIRFATIHVSGTKNGREWVTNEEDDLGKIGEIIDRRDTANIAWITKSFEKAKSENASAIVLAMQADMNFHGAEHFEERYKYGARCKGATQKGRPKEDKCDAFVELRDTIFKQVADYGGPVLIIHGDTWPFMLSKVFAKAGPDSDLWVLNVAGDAKCSDGEPESVSNATVVTIKPSSKSPFEAARLLGKNYQCE